MANSLTSNPTLTDMKFEISEDVFIPFSSILIHLRNQYNKQLERFFNDGSRIFTAIVDTDLHALNRKTQRWNPTKIKMFIIFDYKHQTKELSVDISSIVIRYNETDIVERTEAVRFSLANLIRDKFLGLYTSTLF